MLPDLAHLLPSERPLLPTLKRPKRGSNICQGLDRGKMDKIMRQIAEVVR
jgi:hypothetical protein